MVFTSIRVRALGGLLLLIGLGLFGYVAWDIATHDAFFPAMVGGGVAAFVVGGVMAVFGNPADRPIPEPLEVEVPPEVERILSQTKAPFHFCLACHDVAVDSKCERCGSVVSVMEIRDADDAAIARAALEPVKAKTRELPKFEAAESSPLDPAVERLLAETPRPFSFCTRHAEVVEDAYCPRCKGGVDVLEIRDAADVAMARAAMG
jgi:hypothetical protein